MGLTDTHCHLDFNLFDLDRSLVVERAIEAGINRILNPGIDLETSRNAIGLCQMYEPCYAAVGVHPNDAHQWDDQSLVDLRELAAAPRVVAIGEIGLDYYHGLAWRDLQLKILRDQLELAAECSLPVIIHSREASDEIVPMLCAWQADLAAAGNPIATRPGVLHAFSGSLKDAERVINHHFMLGVDGPITYRSEDSLRDVMAAVPMTSILIETDSPFLTPHPLRGSRNEPKNVKYVVEKLSEITNLPVATVEAQTSANAGRIFHW